MDIKQRKLACMLEFHTLSFGSEPQIEKYAKIARKKGKFDIDLKILYHCNQHSHSIA